MKPSIMAVNWIFVMVAIFALIIINVVCGEPETVTKSDINTECIKGSRHVIVDNKKIRLKKFDKNALNQVSDIYCYD